MLQLKNITLAFVLLLIVNTKATSTPNNNLFNTPPEGSDNETKLTEAKQLVLDYKFDTAIRLYQEIYKTDTTNIQILKDLESLYTQTSQNQLALDVTYKILKLDPDNRHYYIRSGLILKKIDEYKAAINIFKSVLETDHSNIYIISQIADIFRETNQVDSAYYYYALACDIKPTTSNLIKCADVLLKNKWNKGAMSFIERYYSPKLHKSKVLQRIYGKSLYLSDSIIGAYNVFRKLYTEGDSSKLTTKFLGLTYWKSAYYSQGTKVLENFIQKDTTDYLAYYVLGRCYKKINKPNKSIKYLNKSLEIYQLNPESLIMIYKGLASSYEDLANFSKAIEYYSLIKEEDETNIYGEYKIAMIYDHELNNKTKALDYYNSLMTKMNAPNTPPNDTMKKYCQSRIDKIKESDFWNAKQ